MRLFKRSGAGGDGEQAVPEGAADDVVADGSAAGSSTSASGPWDSADVERGSRVDLGALQLPPRQGMELRLEVDEKTRRVTAATVLLGGSAVQLQAFAAPRTEGVWDEIRADIRAAVERQGGSVDEVSGEFGAELLARVPVRTPDGRTGHQVRRFCGVDGPRWFVRAVFTGPAAYESAAAAPLEEVVRDVVVVRGAQAMAPKELLPLALPAGAAPGSASGSSPGSSPGSAAVPPAGSADSGDAPGAAAPTT